MLALLLLCAVPAPRDNPSPFPVGSFSVAWGHISQGMTFYANGNYHSPEFGSGKWSQDNEGWIWFSERDDTTHYAMWLDPKTGTGKGWSHDRTTGEYTGELKVRMAPRECLPMPRVTE